MYRRAIARRIYLIVAVFILPSTACRSATVLVKQDGSGDATTINGALEMLDYNDGEDDVVLIGPGLYSEQIKPKGNAGVDSTAFPVIFDLSLEKIEAAYSSHTDHLTLEGIESVAPPVITVVTGTVDPYGFFPGDPGDYMTSALLLCGNGVTYKNLEIRHSGGGNATYAMNGQASGVVFEDCLFTNGLPEWAAHDDFCDYQTNAALTSIVNATVSADNDYTYLNCLMDGRSKIDGSLFDSVFIWFHGFEEIVELANVDPVGGVIFEGCTVRHWDNLIHEFRGRTGSGTGLAFSRIEDSFFEGVGGLFEWRGSQGPGVFNRNVVKNLGTNEAAVRMRNRSQAMPSELTVANNLIVGATSSSSAMVLLGFDDDNSVPGTNPIVRVVNNTFHDYSGGAVVITGNSPRGQAVVANNTFTGREGASDQIGVSVQNQLVHSEVFNNLFFNNSIDIDGAPDLNQNNVFADPEFLTTILIEPELPGAPTVQGFLPLSAAAVGAGSAAIYQELEPVIGNLDVDGDTREVIDIGAQWIGDPPPTSTPTVTPTPSNTPTPTNTFTPTATPTPTNPPPSDPIVSIEPEEPFTFDDLLCNATGSVDPDGGEVTYSYKWSRNGLDLTIENETDFSGPSVPSEETTRDEVWRCEVTAEDDEGKRSFGVDEVTIQNSLPTQPEIEVLPPNPLPGDGRAVLLVTFSTDADNDAIVYLFQWFRLDLEGIWQMRPEVSGTLQPYSPGQAEISGLYTAGETWKVEVTPLEARTLVKRGGAKGIGEVIAGPPAIDQWIVLPDFGNDGMIDSEDILTLLELWRNDIKAFPPETYPDLILISTLGWQGKAEGGK